MIQHEDLIFEGRLSRRAFVRGAGSIATLAAALAALGCAPETQLSPMPESGADHPPLSNPEEGGVWVSAACWHQCGGRCMNKVMVQDGVVIRQKTDDTHEDSFDYPQQRGCVRGRAQQQQCFGADRLRYPMKRKHWQPGGGENSRGDLRGKDEWERISWDEAISLMAQEMLRVKETYGCQAFYDKKPTAALKAFGGASTNWDTGSHGTYCLDTQLCGLPWINLGMANDRYDMLNADTIILWSANPAWSAAGLPAHIFQQVKEAGVRFIVVDPCYNATGQMLDAEWVPVRGGTDMALMMGVAYEMLRLDAEEGDVVDWDFLHTYTVGFDMKSMPDDKSVDENLRDYLLGAYDDIPKTPEWAAKRCGTPPEQITSLARELGMKNKVMILHNYAMARCHGTEMLPQMLLALGAMGGHMGKSGHACGTAYNTGAGMAGPALVNAGSTGLPPVPNPIDHVAPAAQVWGLIKNGGGPYRYVGDWLRLNMSPGRDEEYPEIHGIFHEITAQLQTGINMAEGIEAHRAVDFVFTRAQFLTTNALYSDIVLPVTTEWERIGGFGEYPNREVLLVYTQVVGPLYEAKTDQEIERLLLEALGMNPDDVYPLSEKQQFFNQLAGSTVVDADSETGVSPLLTITQADIDEWEVEGAPQEGAIGLAEFLKNGSYQIPRHADDEYGFIGYEDFIADPAAHPLSSASGKFEIYCQARADLLNSFQFDERVFKPYPVYYAPKLGYESTFKEGDIEGEKGDYPYLLFNPHYMGRSHSTYGNCPWLREAWRRPVFLNASDAAEKGVEDGDTVLLWTKDGKTLRSACVMETIIPGQVGLPHGAWVDIDEETGIDRGGADNYLIGNDLLGMGASGYNNCNCNFEKYDGESLVEDCLRPQRIVDLED